MSSLSLQKLEEYPFRVSLFQVNREKNQLIYLRDIDQQKALLNASSVESVSKHSLLIKYPRGEMQETLIYSAKPVDGKCSLRSRNFEQHGVDALFIGLNGFDVVFGDFSLQIVFD